MIEKKKKTGKYFEQRHDYLNNIFKKCIYCVFKKIFIIFQEYLARLILIIQIAQCNIQSIHFFQPCIGKYLNINHLRFGRC